ncbi:hypothetical protein ACWNT8_11030 [Pigmentibacter ruber]
MHFLKKLAEKWGVKLVILSLFAVPFSVSASEEVFEYTVQPNDNLSTILQKLSLKPIYGKNGSLAEVLKLNPEKQESEGNCIYAGEVILLPKSMLTKEKLNLELKKEIGKQTEIKKTNENNNVKATLQPKEPKVPVQKNETVVIQQHKEPKVPVQKNETVVIQQHKEPKVPVQKSETVVTQQPKEPKVPVQKSETVVTQQPKEPKVPVQKNETIYTQQAKSATDIKPASFENKNAEKEQSLQNKFSKPNAIITNILPNDKENKPNFNKLNEILISNSKDRSSNQVTKQSLEFANSSKIENHLFSSQKTILLAMPLKKQEISREDNLSSSSTKSSPVSNSYFRKEVFLSDENSCDIFPSCKFWLWDLNNKCCNPKKPFFMFTNDSSLK